MPTARDLYELQNVDQALDALRVRLASLEAGMGDHSALDTRARGIEERRAAVQRMQLDQAAADVEAGSRRQRFKDVEGKLYGGGVTNPKELEALQREHEALQQQVAAEDAKLLEMMEALDKARSGLAADESGLPEAEARWKREQDELAQQVARGRSELQALEARRASVTRALAPQDVAVYQRLRSTRAGVAVARIERGVCNACHVSMPGPLMQRARAGRELVFCPSCGRILVS